MTQDINLLCRNCNTRLEQTAVRTLGAHDHHDRVLNYRCPSCRHGGERYIGGDVENCQFGPVFRPDQYSTQLRIEEHDRTVNWPETGVKVNGESPDAVEVVADD